MRKAEEPRRIHEANVACGDIGEAEEIGMLARISAAERMAELERAAA